MNHHLGALTRLCAAQLVIHFGSLKRHIVERTQCCIYRVMILDQLLLDCVRVPRQACSEIMRHGSLHHVDSRSLLAESLSGPTIPGSLARKLMKSVSLVTALRAAAIFGALFGSIELSINLSRAS